LYQKVEKIGIELLTARNNGKVLSANIDFYSGFVYDMMGLPIELYTPFFAVSRVSGWGAHAGRTD
jgi:citrate synthase